MNLFKTAAWGAAVAYVLAASMPVSWLWFNPGPVAFGDAVQGHAPALIYSRTINRVVMISYSSVTRNAATGEIMCDGSSGPFEYQPNAGPIVGKDLVWWTSGNEACADLPPGAYWAQTVWTIPTPFRALLPEWAKGTALDRLLPPRTVTRDSSAFTILPWE